MSRFIDADSLLKMTFSKGINEDGLLYVPLGEVLRNIKEAPTAYDVEKVVAELEEERDSTYFVETANPQNQHWHGVRERDLFNEIISIVNELAEEYKGGWIPCSERLPQTNESVLCWAKSTARGGDVCFVGSCHNGFWFLQSSADTHSFPGQYVIVAWQPLPEPYQQKEGDE